jgi:hypothetical protein
MQSVTFALCAMALAACGDAGTSVADASSDAGIETDAPAIDAAEADALVSIATSPPFAPAFSLGVHDYAIRCPSAHNPVTVIVTTTTSSNSKTEDFVPNEDFVVAGSYHLRCLPPDFPTVDVTTHSENGAPSPGYYLVNSRYYAIVLDTNGTPVWYQRSTGITLDVDALAQNQISCTSDAEIPVSSDTKPSFDVRDLVTLVTTTIKSPDAPTDAHELRRLPNGDFLVITDRVVQNVDLTGLGTFGAHESMVDSQIEELDATNHVVWSWRASDHIDPRAECVQPDAVNIAKTLGADVFHCNSIDVDAAGNLVLSMRNESAVYYVDKTTGAVTWKLGGTASVRDGAEHIDVVNDPQTTFRLQHDARIASNGDVTMFDDGDGSSSSRAAHYTLDHTAHTATLVWQWAGAGPSTSQGSFRRYADGHRVIGWGAAPTPRVLTEIDAAGNAVLDVAFGGGPNAGISYRAVKVPTSQLDIALLRATSTQ